MTMVIEADKIATVHYTGTFPEGGVFDSSEGGDPLTFLVGHQQVIDGFEDEMLGATVGETRKFTLTPDEAYGHRDEAATQDAQRSDFSYVDMDVEQALEHGIPFHATNEKGQEVQFRIVAIEGDIVKIDFNHPMAGKTLRFAVEVVDIRDAAPEELSHGHVHGPGGHHH